jgi:hypothetical protein
LEGAAGAEQCGDASVFSWWLLFCWSTAFLVQLGSFGLSLSQHEVHHLLPCPCAAAAMCSILTDKREEEEQAVESWRPDSFVVNGQVTSHNPWAANSQLGLDINRYREAQARLRAKREAEAAADGSSNGSSSSSSSSSKV